MKKLFYIIICITLFTGCKKEQLGESLIDTSAPLQNETDKWIYSNYTKPYNIEVKYRWDKSEVDQTSVLAPPKLSQVEPFLYNMKNTWIDPYVKFGGETFMKKFIPKLIILVGSTNVNSEGGFILGQAEGGRKVTIYELNNISFDLTGLSDREKEKKMKVILQTLRTMHHEFGHILHQNTAFSIEYKKVTPNYIRNWMTYSDSDANKLGFITAYSMLNFNEDFVELLSHFVTTPNESWNKLIDEIVVKDDKGVVIKEKTEFAINSLRQKEKILADYMLTTWKIDIYALQKDITEKIDEIRNPKN